MKKFYIKYRGTKTVYEVRADNQQQAREKFAKHNNQTVNSYIQIVKKFTYQELSKIIIN